jgi:hypothetical protein
MNGMYVVYGNQRAALGDITVKPDTKDPIFPPRYCTMSSPCGVSAMQPQKIKACNATCDVINIAGMFDLVIILQNTLGF